MFRFDQPETDPRSTPAPTPGAGVFDYPLVWLTINSEWAGHVDGLLQRLDDNRAWTGTDAEIDAAIDDVAKLQRALIVGHDLTDASNHQLTDRSSNPIRGAT